MVMVDARNSSRMNPPNFQDHKTLKYSGYPEPSSFNRWVIDALGQYDRSVLKFIGERGDHISLTTGNKR